MRSLNNFFTLLLALACTFSFTGCGAKAKKQRFLERGHEYFAQKDYERARLEYLNALRLQPDNVEVILNLSTIFFDRAEPGPAYAFLMRAKELQPTNLTVRANLGNLLLAVGQVKEAREEGEYIFSQDPANGEGHVLLAGSAIRTNEVQETMTRLQALVPKYGATNAWLHLGLGNLHLKQRDIKAAEDAFKKGESIDPKSPRFQLALANVYWFQGQTNEADAKFKAAAELAPVKSGERLRWADYKLKTGQVEEGKKILEEAVKQAPDFLAAHNALADIAIAEKKLEDAAVHVQKALDQDPNNYGALMARSRIHLLQKEFTKAIDDLEVLSKQYPKDPFSQYQLSLAHLANNRDTGKAMVALDKAINLNTNYVEALVLRSELQIQSGDLANALPTLQKITTSYPQLSKPFYLLAAAYRARNTIDDSLEVYQEMQPLFPRDPQPSYYSGLILRAQNKTNEARAAFEKALQISPLFLPPIDEIIELDIAAQKHDRALQMAEGYIKDHPDRPAPHFLKAKVLASQNKVAEAEASLKKAIELEPAYQPAHQALAQLYIATQNTEEALKKLKEMVAANPKDLRSLLQLGVIQEASGNREEAKKSYEQALEVDPKFAAAMNNLAYILGEEGKDLDRAAQLAMSARQITGQDPFSADTLGWIEFKRGDYARALQLIQEAAQRLGNQPEVLVHLGMTHYMLGNEGSARATLEAALKSPRPLPVLEMATNALAVLNIDPAKPADNALATLNARVGANPKDVFAHLRLAEIYARQKDSNTAQKHLEAARAASPKAAAVLMRYASFALNSQKNNSKALELAREAWSAAPLPIYALELGRIGYQAGDPVWALPLLNEAYRAETTNARPAFYLGLVNYAVGKIATAQEMLQEAGSAKTAFPEQEVARMTATLVSLHEDITSPAKAETAANQLLQAFPDYAPAHVARGLLAESKNSFPEAKAHYERALKAYPAFVPAQRQLAILLSDKLADDNTALDLATKVRTLVVDDPQISKVLGKIYYRRGDYTQASRFLKESLSRVQTEDADLLYHLGMAQYHLKDAQARQSLTRALSLDKSQKLAGEAEKALAELKK